MGPLDIHGPCQLNSFSYLEAELVLGNGRLLMP